MIRSIPLGIYSQRGADVLTYFIKHYIPRDHGVAHYTWRDIIKFEQQPDGEICLQIDTNYWHYHRSSWYSRRTVVDAKNFFIGQIRKYAMIFVDNELRKNKSLHENEKTEDIWNSNCTIPLLQHSYYSVLSDDRNKIPTIGDLKSLIEAMLGRKRMVKHITSDQIVNIIGIKRNPIETEFETARRDEIKRINDTYHNDIGALDSQYYTELKDFKEKLKIKYENLKTKRGQQRASELAAIENIGKNVIVKSLDF